MLTKGDQKNTCMLLGDGGPQIIEDPNKCTVGIKLNELDTYHYHHLRKSIKAFLRIMIHIQF